MEEYRRATEGRYDVELIIGSKVREYQDLVSEGVRGYEGVSSFIAVLEERGCKLAVVTSSLRAEAEAVLAGLGLSSQLSTVVVVAAEDVRRSKPDPEGYIVAARALGVAARDCLAIEDAPSGVAAAKASGMNVVAVTNTHSGEELRQADAVVTSLDADLANRVS